MFTELLCLSLWGSLSSGEVGGPKLILTSNVHFLLGYLLEDFTGSSLDVCVRGGVGGTALLEEALRSSYIIPLVVRFLCLVLVLEDVGFHLPAPVTMHAVCYRAFAPT